MPGELSHSPAKIVRQLLINLGKGSEPNAGSAWPVFAVGEPDAPDSALVVYDTEGKKTGRTQYDGEVQGFHGIMVKVRAASHDPGYAKADAIKIAFDEEVYDDVVAIGARTYNVHSISRVGDPIDLGTGPNDKRKYFTINAFASIRQLT